MSGSQVSGRAPVAQRGGQDKMDMVWPQGRVGPRGQQVASVLSRLGTQGPPGHWPPAPLCGEPMAPRWPPASVLGGPATRGGLSWPVALLVTPEPTVHPVPSPPAPRMDSHEACPTSHEHLLSAHWVTGGAAKPSLSWGHGVLG